MALVMQWCSVHQSACGLIEPELEHCACLLCVVTRATAGPNFETLLFVRGFSASEIWSRSALRLREYCTKLVCCDGLDSGVDASYNEMIHAFSSVVSCLIQQSCCGVRVSSGLQLVLCWEGFGCGVAAYIKHQLNFKLCMVCMLIQIFCTTFGT